MWRLGRSFVFGLLMAACLVMVARSGPTVLTDGNAVVAALGAVDAVAMASERIRPAAPGGAERDAPPPLVVAPGPVASEVFVLHQLPPAGPLSGPDLSGLVAEARAPPPSLG
ncbi:hypothetical protein ACRDNQ_14330 [Palleronia sp. KMU-117]|uniref:hypothetical protein n=1 Tax=Palleronia sp. KMU-117 TaxID=3434108 RepID=UPI003D74F7E1